MILPIRLYGDPVLRAKAKPVISFKGVEELARNMLETMYDAQGVGLAAPQVGLGLRLFVAVEYVNEPPEEGQGDTRERVKREVAMVNPRLEVLDPSFLSDIEGCLSIPDIFEEGVERSAGLRVSYQDEHGEPRVLEIDGHFARVIQHEIDHLDGVLFLDHLPREVTVAHRSELADMQRRARSFLKELRAEARPR